MLFNLKTLVPFLALAASVTATLNPATSNTKGKYPSKPTCSPSKTSKAIQAAECAYNTRTSTTETFAVFTTDHQYDSSHGAPYGTCEAYTCAPGSTMATKTDTWTFFWAAAGVKGNATGPGTGCIKSPKDGTCGCENSDGTFVYGGTTCT